MGNAQGGRVQYALGLRCGVSIHRRSNSRQGRRSGNSSPGANHATFQRVRADDRSRSNRRLRPYSGDPHFDTTPANDTEIREGDFVLIDLWAKLNKPRSVYSDLTRDVAFVGKDVPAKIQEVFAVVAAARDAGIQCVQDAYARKRTLQGWEVDQATRDVIEKAGYGEYFIHRTGHSIGQETHGNGANMDNLETHEERRVMPRTCFSIEPGIYLPEFGVRSEVNVYIDENGNVHVTGGEPQTEVHRIMV